MHREANRVKHISLLFINMQMKMQLTLKGSTIVLLGMYVCLQASLNKMK